MRQLLAFLKTVQLSLIPFLRAKREKPVGKINEISVPEHFNVSKNERRLMLELQDYFSKNEQCSYKLPANSISGKPAVLITVQVSSNPLPGGMIKLLDHFNNHVQPK